MLSGKVIIIRLIARLIERTTYKISYYSEPNSRIKNKIKSWNRFV